MADLLMFKSDKSKDEVWEGLEHEFRGWFRLDGIPQDLLPGFLERAHAMFERAMALKPATSFKLDPIVRLTPEEFEGLKRQVEQQFSEKVYPEFLGHIIVAIIFEVLVMEAELFRLRNETGAKVS